MKFLFKKKWKTEVLFLSNLEQSTVNREFYQLILSKIKEFTVRFVSQKHLEKPPTLRTQRILVSADLSDPNQENLDYFMGSEFEPDCSGWFFHRRDRIFNFGYFDISYGGSVLERNGLNRIFDDWIVYDIDLPKYISGSIAKKVWIRIFEEKLKLIKEAKNAQELKDRLVDLYEEEITKVKSYRSIQLETSLLPLLYRYQNNMRLKEEPLILERNQY